jgi:hypothetical protein
MEKMGGGRGVSASWAFTVSFELRQACFSHPAQHLTPEAGIAPWRWLVKGIEFMEI